MSKGTAWQFAHQFMHICRAGIVQHPIEINMVITCSKSHAATQMQGPQSFWADVCTQMDLPRSERVAQISGCGELQNVEVTQETEGSGMYHGFRCIQLDDIFEQLARLQEVVTWLRCIQQLEREIDAWYYALSWAD